MQGGTGDRVTVTMEDVDGLCAWLREQLGERNAVVGISGGVDSSVVAALCVRAVGPTRVWLVRLPCECGSAKNDEYYQMQLCAHLGISSIIRDLWIPYEAMRNAMRLAGDANDERVRRGNIQARLRMTALYDVAAQQHGLVVGTTNLSEYQIGYATKYGDHGVDLEPIQAFPKSDVRKLGRLLGMPDLLVDRVPTAGLWEGQTDEGEIGMSYDLLDSILSGNEHFRTEARRVREMVEASAHKRCVPPHYPRYEWTTA